MSVRGKHIVIGICGSIAAYKITSLVRLLVKAEASIQVILSPDAKEFVTPLTLATVSKNPVLSDYFDRSNGVWNNHVELGISADLMLIAPATANSLSKMANGACDNLLLATYLSAKCPVFFAPAMDLDMWQHPATQRNVSILESYGNKMIAPNSGELASGLIGPGRLAEPDELFEFISDFFNEERPLKGKKALVSAGPTHEAIDPVRFIGNHSSGKMGFAIAEALHSLGAEVTLVSGPTTLPTPPGITRKDVTSAQQMLEACNQFFDNADIIVMSAAVADYTPVETSDQKIKKKEETFQIRLKKTVDILASLGNRKTTGQTLIGFALETNNELENALDKLNRKNLDYIVLNSMQDEGAGFSGDTNKVTILDKNKRVQKFELKSKKEVASDIATIILQHQKAINA
ncbi:bifunctional phosphopantothenoylcysteine decarboxylase/phosphopantothenate--cysteine ligase CoaBC [Sphingobacterium shayense]|uniref:bifunctional phosphopantothenoylcysteine decarboxylase/phosphopantothenate--cysteine ligase CoaBC n=1 Tax=Sphingobacterium shayense TaxID=626343 RepID=UPI001552B3C9|nr:bifunctional phosphopantothenoylcysteine decarboxylase/phosphopantothenate--cysteine ligase CoaBC [Sphingobacterium shayense]NQD71259.1 bifunctional phosphopantothenoylcysteine decarboxylase/phosphopantothenate--cysteine ligase CoaBC [Sphingobacterium shayense]